MICLNSTLLFVVNQSNKDYTCLFYSVFATICVKTMLVILFFKFET